MNEINKKVCILEILTKIYLVLKYILALLWFSFILLYLLIYVFLSIAYKNSQQGLILSACICVIIYILFSLFIITSIKALHIYFKRRTLTKFQKISLFIMPIIEILIILIICIVFNLFPLDLYK